MNNSDSIQRLYLSVSFDYLFYEVAWTRNTKMGPVTKIKLHHRNSAPSSGWWEKSKLNYIRCLLKRHLFTFVKI